MSGTFTDEIPRATLSSSVYDRTLVPEGGTGETLKFYAFNTPIELADGRPWEDDKEKYFQNAMDHFELYAPRTRDLVNGPVLKITAAGANSTTSVARRHK